MLKRLLAQPWPWRTRSAHDVAVTDTVAEHLDAARQRFRVGPTEPLSRNWGYDRGLPIDRYYIESFLARHSTDIRGKVLEIGDSTYTTRFGGERVTRRDVLHVTPGNTCATYTADLTRAEHLPGDSFDCVILTQTLQLIDDVPAALRTVHRILKPGGVLLATVPGLTRTSQVEWPGSWYWRFTPASAQRSFGQVFADAQVETHGNVLSACAFLYGAAVHELAPAELDAHDPDYDVIVTVRASKPNCAAAGAANGALRADRSTTPALILLYHRVSAPGPDPWRLSVTPQHFAQQLEVLRRYARVVPLRDLLAASSSAAYDRPVVAITFDDGYADNLHEALPLLERQRMPATIFVCTKPVARAAEFWWDVLERVLLFPNALPARLALPIAGNTFQWDLSACASYDDVQARAHDGWHVDQPARTPRHALFLALWERFSRLDCAQREEALSGLLAWAGEAARGTPRHRALRPAELQQLAHSSFIDIGAHTENHTALAALSPARQAAEITGSARWLEGLLGRPAVAFSYPFGRTVDYSTDTAQLVRSAGFTIACTNVRGVVGSGSDPLQLPRLQVEDSDGAAFEEAVQQWLAVRA